MTEVNTSIVIGDQQSPINIETKQTVISRFANTTLYLGYRDGTAVGTIKDDNLLISRISCGESDVAIFRGVTYKLVKIHFHKHCEHRIDGCQPSDHELHLVHQRVDSEDKLVIALFFKSDSKARRHDLFRLWNDNLKSLRYPADDTMSAYNSIEVEVKLADLLTANMDRWFTYEGSLTSYPFSQDVTWVINYATEVINPEDIAELQATEQKTRHTQPINRRFVLRNFELG